jgi:SagB-type dehydrogenase family enzyme
MSKIFAVADLRIRLGDWGEGEQIFVDQLTTRQRWRLNRELAAVLVLFIGGRERVNGIDHARELLNISAVKAETAIAVLIRSSLLIIEDGNSSMIEAEIWKSRGWTSAYDHHVATWNYPFIDYSEGGWASDRRRMERYKGIDPDLGAWHHEKCEGLPPGITLPLAMEAISQLDVSVADASHHPPVKGDITHASLAQLLSCGFGKLPSHKGRKKARRSSPSGGARHPIEGYVVTYDVPEMEDAVWHVRSSKNDLVRIGDAPSRSWAEGNLSGLYMAPFVPKVLIIVTAVFERNMYRYREPRTLRTVFIDAGHVLGTLEMIAGALSMASFVHHAINDRAVEEMLGIDGLVEAAIAGISLTGGKNELPTLGPNNHGRIG